MHTFPPPSNLADALVASPSPPPPNCTGRTGLLIPAPVGMLQPRPLALQRWQEFPRPCPSPVAKHSSPMPESRSRGRVSPATGTGLGTPRRDPSRVSRFSLPVGVGREQGTVGYWRSKDPPAPQTDGLCSNLWV